ncbi:DUF1800 domain-containing protein [Porphyrobacter sp. ULC335]|uniref:DUF1800 domain-containing protein n=1 Tax=Porphyrobacter sp. ULC335 TaxID=2854260 RepID=UPI00221F2C3A|nr:DUF1800 domain-containing protein [Porphyrobacter sp. ULC335]UYV16764.1 DUF1800 domain-containing protein [Porphyrobacter sp. ULC335]
MYLPGDDDNVGGPNEVREVPRHSPTLGAPTAASTQTAPSPLAPRAKFAAASTLALAVAACGGGGSEGGSSGGGGSPPVATVRKPQTDAEAARFLLQASLSASTGAIADLRSEGYGPWLDRQFGIANAQTGRGFLADRGFDRVDANRFYNGTITGDYMVWSQLLSGGNSVRKRIAFALSEFFVVSLTGINMVWRAPAIGEYWDILNRHAFGNFRDLLQDITLNPAMGTFLNTRGNRRADSSGRVPDENYAREVMQLFTIGLFELNADGTNRLASGNPIETYTSADVSGLARVFTGYDFDQAGLAFTTEVGGTRQIPDPEFARRPMTADPARWVPARATGFHSAEAKTFLGLTIPANTNAADSLRLALDHLFNHANVGPFFARQMIQRLVTSNPSPAYVGRVAAIFANNGQGRRGDLAAVFKAILTDNEALDAAGLTNPNFGKLREPVLRYVQLARTFGARSNSGNWQIGDLSDAANALGQSPLRSPSVFNFFRPGYFPTNTEIANRGLLAPEFQLVNETSVAGYVNFLERALTGGRAPVADIALDFATEVGLAQDAAALLDRLDLLLTGRQLSAGVRDTIRTAMEDVALTASSTNADRLRRVQIGVTLILASTDYLIQK